MDLYFFPGVEDPLAAEVDLTWAIGGIDENGLQLELTFADPLYVSQNEEADFAIVHMTGFSKFNDK